MHAVICCSASIIQGCIEVGTGKARLFFGKKLTCNKDERSFYVFVESCFG